MPAEAPWLIFVDTNVFLDFYRIPGERARRQLDGLLKHRESLIVTEQVEMEYLKNRQKVITEGLKNIKRASLANVPSLIAESKYGKSAIKSDQELGKKVKKLEDYASRILINPSANDSVYKTATKLFSSDHEWNLKRPNPLRFTIRNRARKRFVMGYPPRKPNDTSIGDAINCEWIIHCAQESVLKHNILIVSRDTDYGVISGQALVLNDWLRTEFRKRVGARRKIILTNKLTVALKKLDELVTQADEEAEQSVIGQPMANYLTALQNIPNIEPEVFKRLLVNLSVPALEIPPMKTPGAGDE